MTDTYKVYDQRSPLREKIYNAMANFTMLAFCIYISQGSTWWTFITGGMFLAFMCFRVKEMMKLKTREFKTKSELQSWVDTLPDDQ